MAIDVRLQRWQDAADIIYALNEQADREDVPKPTYARRLRRLAELFADEVDALPVPPGVEGYVPGEGFELFERPRRVSRRAS